MTLSPSTSLYNMLYDMNNLNPINQTLQPNSSLSDDKSPKRRSIFTVSSNGPSPRTISSSLSGTERQDLLNITEQLTNALRNTHNNRFNNKNDHDHQYSQSHHENLSESINEKNLTSPIIPSSSTCQSSSIVKEQNNLNVNKTCSGSNSCLNMSNEISSSLSLDEISLMTQSSSTSINSKQSQGKIDHHKSFEGLPNRPKNRSSKLQLSRRNGERKVNRDKDKVKEASEKDERDREQTEMETNGIIKFGVNKKQSPEVISIEFCDESTPSVLKNRKNAMVYKAATAFAMGAVRKLSVKVSKLTQESAARFILHSLLLNSWRQSRKQNEKLVKENNNHERTVENMCLQLRVVRQMHREEKEKCLQITELKKERDKTQSELEKVENELNSCQVFVDTLRNQNMELIMSKNELQNLIGQLQSEKQEEVNRRIKIELDVFKNQQTIHDLRDQLNDMTRQKLKWQEDARGHESSVVSLKNEMAQNDKRLVKVQNSYNELQREVKLFKDYKESMQMESQRLKDQLRESLDRNETLRGNVQKVEDALKREEQLNLKMKKLVDEKESQIMETRKDLSLFLQACVNKRRRWADSFHYLVFPWDIFRVIFDTQRDKYNHRIISDNENVVY